MTLFFTQQGQAIAAGKFNAISQFPEFALPKFGTVLTHVFGEERPTNRMILLSTLVILMHLCVLFWLINANESDPIPPKPLMMEVSMILMSAAKPSFAPLLAPATPQAIKNPEPLKTQVKAMSKKLLPLLPKVTDAAPAEKAVSLPTAAQTETSAATSATSAMTSNSKESTSSNAEPFIEANYHANYASNPKPEYPAIAKSREWQGKVLLRVQVSTEGLSESVEVEKSSGHDMLDDAAMEAVKRWRFIPAKRGETAIASSVIVPINFSLFD